MNRDTLKRKQPVRSYSDVLMLSLVLPLILENTLRILLSSVDTFMLNTWSDKAVASAGLISQYIFFIHILFNVICSGTTIVLSQYLGAERKEEAGFVAQASALMIFLTSFVITLGVFFGAKPLLSLYSIEEDVREMAWLYFVIFAGGGSVFIALNMLQGTILRAYGYTRDAMYVSILANVLNIIGNAISLYRPFGIPVLGIAGVAASSAFSQLVACIVLAFRIRKTKEIVFTLKEWKAVPKKIYKTILKIGVPSAGENLAYNTAQIAITAMVTTFGTWAMTSTVYAQTIARFAFVFASSMGTAVQIKTGYLVGAKKADEAYRNLYKYQAIATAISISLVVLLNVFKNPLIALFTKDALIVATVTKLLRVSFYIEFGRSINLVTIAALRGAGDVRFPVFVGILSMWGIMVLGAYLFGVKAGGGLIAIWLAIGTDETLRGFIMLFRWRSKRWMTKQVQ